MMRPHSQSRWRRHMVLLVGLASLLAAGAAPATAQDEVPVPDVCLSISSSDLSPSAWQSFSAAALDSISQRPALFPAPSVDLSPDPESSVSIFDGRAQLLITALGGDAALAAEANDCLEPDSEWTIRVERSFLDDGADRMLQQAPTTPGISSSVDVEWFPQDDRVVTTLVFAGPLDIPNGTCWILDTLDVDEASGQATSTVEHGVKTSLFAESACGRFFDHLVNGGAGQQALRLFPSSVALDDGSTLHLVASNATVGDEAIVLSGVVEVR